MKKKILIVFLICCMLLGVASPAMAAETVTKFDVSTLDYADIPFPDDRHAYDYFVVYANPLTDETLDNCSVYCLSTNQELVGYENNFLRGSSAAHSRYHLVYTIPDDNSSPYYSWYWEYTGNSNVFLGHGNTLLYSSYTIYDALGDVYFPPVPPLLTLVVELVEAQGQILLQKVVGTIQILLPYGISCLALLISLPLLLKVLRRFLV